MFLPPNPRVEFVYQREKYVARVEADRAQPLRVYRNGRLIAATARRDWTPWRLELGDVDGDGRPEIAIGVTKSTRYIKERHTTIFFYSFDGARLTKKWTGSTMGRPVVDFCFAPDKQTIVTLQRTPAGKIGLVTYRWNGFGFDRGAKEKVFETATRVTRYKNKIAVVADGKRVLVDIGGLQ